MTGLTLMIIAMVAMMAVMCGGMLFAAGTAIRRKFNRRRSDQPTT